MKRLFYKCTLPLSQRPEWLRYLLSALHNLWNRPIEGSLEDFDQIKKSLDRLIWNMVIAGRMRSYITTQIVEDSGKTILCIKRNNKLLVSIYID